MRSSTLIGRASSGSSIGGRFGFQADDPVPDERRVWCQAIAPEQPLLRRRAEQAQHEVNRRPPAREVVLQARVDALVAEVDRGRQRGDHDADVEGRQIEEVGQQREVRSGVRVEVVLGESRRVGARGRTLEHAVQPPERGEHALDCTIG